MPTRRLLVLPLVAALAFALTGPTAAAEELPPLPDSAVSTGTEASGEGRGHRHTHGPDGLELDRGRRGSSVVAETVDSTLSGPWVKDPAYPVVSSDVADPVGLAGLPQIHLVYLYPADLKTPRTSFLPMFQADARAAQKFLTDRYGRSVRFDERSDGRLDITSVKSRYRTSQLGGRNQFDLVASELKRVFPDSESPRKKYIAWLDAPSQYCGQGELYGDWHRDKDNWNDLRTAGVVYRPHASTGSDGGFCRGRTLLHELGHNLGALYGKAPNAFDGAHCNDDKNDVMCYQSAVTSNVNTGPTSTGEFDYQHDDYWDLGAELNSINASSKASGAHLRHLNWWGVNLSRFVCRPAAAGVVPRCDDAATVLPAVDEYRYHSGAETSPAPAEQPTG